MRSAQRSPQRAGFILIVALAFLAGIMALIAVGTSRSMTERLAVERFVAKQQAFYLAEAGVDQALAQLTANPDFTCTGCTTPLSLGPGTTVTYDVTGTTPKTVTARATVNGVPRTITAMVEGPSAASIFRWGLFAEMNIALLAEAAGGLIDSYDSSDGSYPYANLAPADERPRTSDLIRTNYRGDAFEAAFEDWNSSGPVHYWGDITIGPGSDPSGTGIWLSPSSVIHGETHIGETPIVLPPIAPPAGSPSGSTTLYGCQVNQSNPDVPLSRFTEERLGNLRVEKDCTVRLIGDGVLHLHSIVMEPRSTLRFGGGIQVAAKSLDIGLSISGVPNPAAYVIVEPTGSAEIYVGVEEEAFGFRSNYGWFQNQTRDPSKLALYVRDYSVVSLRSTAAEPFYGIVYAPYSQLSFHECEYFGSFIGAGITIDVGQPANSFTLHFDRALARMGVAGGGGAQGATLRYWGEE